jgi:hypothetical protein
MNSSATHSIYSKGHVMRRLAVAASLAALSLAQTLHSTSTGCPTLNVSAVMALVGPRMVHPPPEGVSPFAATSEDAPRWAGSFAVPANSSLHAWTAFSRAAGSASNVTALQFPAVALLTTSSRFRSRFSERAVALVAVPCRSPQWFFPTANASICNPSSSPASIAVNQVEFSFSSVRPILDLEWSTIAGARATASAGLSSDAIRDIPVDMTGEQTAIGSGTSLQWAQQTLSEVSALVPFTSLWPLSRTIALLPRASGSGWSILHGSDAMDLPIQWTVPIQVPGEIAQAQALVTSRSVGNVSFPGVFNPSSRWLRPFVLTQVTHCGVPLSRRPFQFLVQIETESPCVGLPSSLSASIEVIRKRACPVATSCFLNSSIDLDLWLSSTSRVTVTLPLGRSHPLGRSSVRPFAPLAVAPNGTLPSTCTFVSPTPVSATSQEMILLGAQALAQFGIVVDREQQDRIGIVSEPRTRDCAWITGSQPRVGACAAGVVSSLTGSCVEAACFYDNAGEECSTSSTPAVAIAALCIVLGAIGSFILRTWQM